MSRLGRTPIVIPQGVTISEERGKVMVKGPKGNLDVSVPDGISVQIEDNKALVQFDAEKLEGPMHGLYRSLINNAILGTSTGFSKELSLVGVGFRAAVKGNVLDLMLGFSHPCQVEIPKGLEVKVDKNTSILISGIDKQVVGQFAATVRSLRPPEPYKGKGVRYKDEYVRKKAGKAAKGK